MTARDTSASETPARDTSGRVPGTAPTRRAVVGGLAGLLGVPALAACGPDERTTPPAGRTTPAPATSGGIPASGQTAAPTSPPPASSPTPLVLLTDGPDITRGPAGGSAVALTFHGAGDPAITRQVLAVLAAATATVTVFAVGQWLAANPALGREIIAAGHDLGNHTWSHQAMRSLDAAAATSEVARGAAAVGQAVGSVGPLFRPSGTQTSTSVIRAAAAAAGYRRCISYDVDPQDYADPGRAAVASRTLKGVSDGSIVSLHLGHQGTLDALPDILSGLAARRLRPVRLTTLLGGGT